LTPRPYVAVEGDTDAAVAEVLLAHVGMEAADTIVCGGSSVLDARLPGYLVAARSMSWFILRDLDTEAPCAPALVAKIAPHRPSGMVLRIAVRELESWLLADAARIAEFLHVPVASVPRAPDTLPDPKRELVTLARRSTNRVIKKQLVPGRGRSGVVGPVYASRIAEFARTRWRPAVAASRSPSLERCVKALRRLRGP
jgi:hypothetical protein